MFDVAPAFSSNPKDNDGEIQVTLTDAFQVKGDLLNVPQLSLCPWKSIEELCMFFPFPLLRTTWVFKRGRWSQESPGLRRSASSCWACFCWVHLRDYRDSLLNRSGKQKGETKQFEGALARGRRRMLMPRSTVEKHRCPLRIDWLFCWLLAQMYDSKVWFLWRFCSPTSRTFSSREFWCPASFVEPLWSSLLAEASLQGSRSIVSPHVRTCWSNPSRCGRNLVPAVFWALKTEHPSSKNKFASAAGVIT